jgi:hypothetical protein
MAQLQHNICVTASRTAALSIITGGGKRKFWRCVQSGEPPRPFGIEPPRPRIEAVRTVDMSGTNAWAEFANLYRLTRPAALDAKAELKALVPEDAKEAAGHGVRAKRSKSGAISFEVLELEAGHAVLQR